MVAPRIVGSLNSIDVSSQHWRNRSTNLGARLGVAPLPVLNVSNPLSSCASRRVISKLKYRSTPFRSESSLRIMLFRRCSGSTVWCVRWKQRPTAVSNDSLPESLSFSTRDLSVIADMNSVLSLAWFETDLDHFH